MAEDKEEHGRQRNLFLEMTASAVQSSIGLWGHSQRHPAETVQMVGKVWQSFLSSYAAKDSGPSEDKRFSEDGWEAPYFSGLKEHWLNVEAATNDWLDQTGEGQGIHHRRRQYMLNFLLAAWSPKNFALTNPEAVRRSMDENGLNLVRGAQNLIEDITRHGGLPSKVDPDAFEIGKDIAGTNGAVIFRDELCEIIQFTPQTPQVRATPILLVWSVINRFYLLDLTEERSIVRQLLQDGHQVFLQSWKNPGTEEAHWALEDYARAARRTFDVVREVSKSDSLNVMPVCAGAYPTYAAVLLAQSEGDRGIKGVVALVSAVDNQAHDTLFGLIGTSDTIETAKAQVQNQNGFSSDALSWSLSLLQPDRMLFPYFYEGYVLGTRRPPSEVAYWLADQVNISTGFYEQLLDYITQNAFTDPEKMQIDGHPIRLSDLDSDLLLVAALHDNLMPWRAAYRTIKHVACPVEFVLTSGGHITPMTAKVDDPRVGYWSHQDAPRDLDADAWLDGAQWHQESWLNHLGLWLKARSGDMVSAPTELGCEKHPVLCPAPGTYAFS
ncbi:MAG: hypothetical protein AAFY25_12970 [Pseudomonadota bacterium]